MSLIASNIVFSTSKDCDPGTSCFVCFCGHFCESVRETRCFALAWAAAAFSLLCMHLFAGSFLAKKKTSLRASFDLHWVVEADEQNTF